MRFVMLLLAHCAFVLPVERMGGTAKCCPDKRCIFGNCCCDVDLNIDDNMMSCMMPTIKRQDKTPHKETRIASPSFYIVDKCPQDVNDTEDGETPLENVTLADQVPVWSPSKRRIYRSQYISKCHNVSDGQTWSVAISCHLPRANESPEFVLDSIDNFFVASTDKDCDAIFVYGGDINELEPLLCFDYTDYELIGSCSFSDEYLMERYNHSDDRVRCERGSIARFSEFKNIACFRCNIDLKIEVSSLDCPEIPYSVTKSPSDSLLVVLDFQGLRQSQDKKDDNALVCTQAKQGSRKCKRVTCPFGFDSYDGMCVIRNTTQIGRVNVMLALKFQAVHVNAKFIDQYVTYLKTQDQNYLQYIVTLLKTQEMIKFSDNTWIETWSCYSIFLSTHDNTDTNARNVSLHFVVTFINSFTSVNYADLILNITQLLKKPLVVYDANGEAQVFDCSLYPFDRWQLKTNSNNLYIPAWDLAEVHNTSCCSHSYQGITYSNVLGSAFAFYPPRLMFLSKLLFCEQIDLGEHEISILAPDNAILVGDTVLSKHEFRKFVAADGHIMYRVCISDASSIIHHDTSPSNRHSMCFMWYVRLFVFIWFTML